MNAYNASFYAELDWVDLSQNFSLFQNKVLGCVVHPNSICFLFRLNEIGLIFPRCFPFSKIRSLVVLFIPMLWEPNWLYQTNQSSWFLKVTSPNNGVKPKMAGFKHNQKHLPELARSVLHGAIKPPKRLK